MMAIIHMLLSTRNRTVYLSHSNSCYGVRFPAKSVA